MLTVSRRDAAAAAQFDTLESGQGVPLPGAFMSFVRMVPASFMSRARLLGLLAQTMGRTGQAVNHFEDALAFNRGLLGNPDLRLAPPRTPNRAGYKQHFICHLLLLRFIYS